MRYQGRSYTYISRYATGIVDTASVFSKNPFLDVYIHHDCKVDWKGEVMPLGILCGL